MTFILYLKTFLIHEQHFSLFVPDETAVKESYEKESISFPYWCQVWPAAIAMSDFLLRHPEYIQHKTVLELAAGLGLPSIVSAQEASTVICSDYLPEAVAVIQRSAKHNHLQNLRTRLLDWHCLPDDLTADVLLLSDVNYEPSLFEVQQAAIKNSCNKEPLLSSAHHNG